jgi:hypothetical protein
VQTNLWKISKKKDMIVLESKKVKSCKAQAYSNDHPDVLWRGTTEVIFPSNISGVDDPTSRVVQKFRTAGD